MCLLHKQCGDHREIALGLVTAVVVASESEVLCNEICDILGSDYFRVFTSTDVIGVEVSEWVTYVTLSERNHFSLTYACVHVFQVGGAVKNVIAIAAGMCEGLGLGTNAMAALVTRGCNEMQRLALTLGARPSTLTGNEARTGLSIIQQEAVSSQIHPPSKVSPIFRTKWCRWCYANLLWPAVTKSCSRSEIGQRGNTERDSWIIIWGKYVITIPFHSISRRKRKRSSVALYM